MMNDGMLSQDEIDALLKVGADEEPKETKETTHEEIDSSKYLSNTEIDTLGEIGNISFGSSATTLSTLLNHKVEITTPSVSIISKNQIDEAFQFEHVSVQVNYVEGFSGKNVLVIKAEDAAVISDVMLGGTGEGPFEELNEIHLSAVQEAMNQMMGAAATSMSTVFDKRVDISPPSISQSTVAEDHGDDEFFVKVSFQLKVGSLIDSSIMQLMPIHFAKQLVEDLLEEEQAAQAEAAVAVAEPVMQQETAYSAPQMATQTQVNEGTPIQTMNTSNETQFIGNQAILNKNNVQQAEFSNFSSQGPVTNQHRNLDMLLDIPLKVTVELGRTKRTIKDILDLTAGSIVELDKLAGEPVDILVNDKLIAQGEVVVIDENFGVRVTDIISQSDRLMKLK